MKNHNYYSKIKEYYDQSNWLYKYFWYAGPSRGLHFGFATKETKNHTVALINQYKYVIDATKINTNTLALDAGCGVGGAAIYLAKKLGARVVGISLVPKQIKEARREALRQGVDKKVKFRVADYLQTGLKSGVFDVIFAIESACYAEPKKAFIKEAKRLLKQNGKIVITDGYLKRNPRGVEEIWLKDFCEGWRLQNLINYREMTNIMRANGFEKINEEDKTGEIQMSINKMKKLIWWWKIGEVLLGWIKSPSIEMLRDNAKAMNAWILGVESGMFGYFAHTAEKKK